MRKRLRLKQLYSPPGIIGWAIITWKVLDLMDTATFVLDAVKPVWEFMQSPTGAVVLLVLGFGLLTYVVLRPEKARKAVEVETQSQTGTVAPMEASEALAHVVVDRQPHFSLTIHRGRAGWPVMYPLRLHDRRPRPVHIVGYNVNVLWDDTPVQRIEWRAPSAEASNGLLVHPPFDSSRPLEALVVQADDWYRLDVPVNVAQIPNWPLISPRWTARGTMMLSCGEETRDIQFNLDTDDYRLSERDWAELRNQCLPDGG